MGLVGVCVVLLFLGFLFWFLVLALVRVSVAILAQAGHQRNPAGVESALAEVALCTLAFARACQCTCQHQLVETAFTFSSQSHLCPRILGRAPLPRPR